MDKIKVLVIMATIVLLSFLILPINNKYVIADSKQKENNIMSNKTAPKSIRQYIITIYGDEKDNKLSEIADGQIIKSIGRTIASNIKKEKRIQSFYYDKYGLKVEWEFRQLR